MIRALPLSALCAASIAACIGPPAPAPAQPAGGTPPASPSAGASASAAPAAGKTVFEIRKEARALAPLMKSALVKEFLAAADDLPAQATRRFWHDAKKTQYHSDAEVARLSEAERRALYPRDVDEELYYVARYGTPMAYARPLDLLGLGKDGLAGKRVLDFGFGAVGQLRIFAALGAYAAGIEVDALCQALYTAPGDQGTIHGRLGRDGEVRLFFGFFPADAALRQAVGTGYDLFISKNVLKRGYIHPERFAPEKHLISLGVDDETFVRTLHGMLVPGGRVLIYNITPPPAPPDKPYIPWADGRCPFAREVWEKVGFRVLEFDRDDTPAAKAMARALEWDKKEEGGDDFFATYTLAQKP
jgi:hypothetical protein